MQSLLYEKAHLQREINICRDFTYAATHAQHSWPPSASHKEIQLRPMDEYLKACKHARALCCAYRMAAVPADQDKDAHQLHLCRLQHELQERKRYVGGPPCLPCCPC